MHVLIDVDACPVVDIAVSLCLRYEASCTLLCDTAHQMHRDGVATLVFDKGADSVDFALVNRVRPGDLVITQDYGLASMCLARSARVMHQDGWEYSADNISGLLEQRHAAKKFRAMWLLSQQTENSFHKPLNEVFMRNHKKTVYKFHIANNKRQQSFLQTLVPWTNS